MNCYTVMMEPFIGWLLDEEPRPEGWTDLFSEYVGLRENKSTTFIIRLMKEIGGLKAKYKIISLCCKTLAVTYSRDLVNELRTYGFRQAFDWSNKVQYSEDIRAVMSLSNKLVTQWLRKEEELENYRKKYAGGEQTKKDFYVWAVTLGKHNNHAIDFKNTSVGMWCQYLNQYDMYCEMVNAQENNLMKKGYKRNK